MSAPTTSALPSRTPAPVPVLGKAPSRPWTIVAMREMTVKLTDRNFIISTVVTLVLILASLAFQGFMATRSQSFTVAVTTQGAAQVVESASRLGSADGGQTTLSARTVSSPGAAEAAVREGSADAALLPSAVGWQLVGDRSPDSTLESTVTRAVEREIMTEVATRAGTSYDTVAAQGKVTYRLLNSEVENAGFYAVTGFIFAFLFYFASIMFGMGIANSVVEEKQSRIVEILATAIPVRELLTGKVIGNLVLALGQLVVFVGFGLVGLSFTTYKKLLPGVAGASGWFVLFFVVGFGALACLWAMAGALATRVEDLQSTTTPLATLLMVALFGGIGLSGSGLVIGSFVPIMSSIAMPRRLLEGGVSWWEPVASIGLTAAFAVAAIRFGATIYRRSLLQTQGRLSIRDALKVEA